MKWIMSTHGKDKMVILDGFEELKVHTFGAAQAVGWFWFKYRKVRVYNGFFPGKTCELLFVRGTTSFYNKKLQILPVGEGARWNLPM